MSKIKLTKSELKNQRDSLKRFSRYLPTLQLKKQQLQLEARHARDALATLEKQESEFRNGMRKWVDLAGQELAKDVADIIKVGRWDTAIRNIAGIDTPVFVGLVFQPVEYDLFSTPPWFDEAAQAVQKLAEFALRRELLEEQLRLIEQELRVTTQRVNLFEKVKIPEARENIRRIQIYLGDQQANAVGRAKIAKTKCRARELAQVEELMGAIA